jgi:hypothetical protein
VNKTESYYKRNKTIYKMDSMIVEKQWIEEIYKYLNIVTIKINKEIMKSY